MGRRFALAAALVCGVAAAQPLRLSVEDFDRGGLPATPRTAAERELSRRISGHRSGDVDGAVEIQRSLAAYYRGQGDERRARAAEERAAAAASSRTGIRQRGGRAGRGEAAPMLYGAPPPRPPAQSEPPSETAAPVDNPAGTSVDIPLYVPAAPPSEGEAGAAPRVDLTPPEASAAPAPEPAEGAPKAVRPVNLSGRFWMLSGHMLHTWEFRPDGRFEHTWSSRDNLNAASLEAGTYQIAGPYLMLWVLRQLADGRETLTPAGIGGRQARRLRFEALGSGAGGGIVLDGATLQPR